MKRYLLGVFGLLTFAALPLAAGETPARLADLKYRMDWDGRWNSVRLYTPDQESGFGVPEMYGSSYEEIVLDDNGTFEYSWGIGLQTDKQEYWAGVTFYDATADLVRFIGVSDGGAFWTGTAVYNETTKVQTVNSRQTRFEWTTLASGTAFETGGLYRASFEITMETGMMFLRTKQLSRRRKFTETAKATRKKQVRAAEAVIANLGAEMASARAAAGKQLEAMGWEAAPVILAHWNDPDPEIRMQARAIVSKLKGTPPTTSPPRPTGKEDGLFYRIKTDDTWGSLSDIWDVTADAIRKANQLEDDAALKPDQRIKIPLSDLKDLIH